MIEYFGLIWWEEECGSRYDSEVKEEKPRVERRVQVGCFPQDERLCGSVQAFVKNAGGRQVKWFRVTDVRGDGFYVCVNPLTSFGVELFLVSRRPCFRYMFDLLQVLGRAYEKGHGFEKYVEHVLYGVGDQGSGGLLLHVQFGDETVVCDARMRELPIVDDQGFEFILNSGLDSEQVVQVFEHLLLENSVILYSKHEEKLISTCEALLSLFYPFEWQGVYVPVLPRGKWESTLSSPVPFLLGIVCANNNEEMAMKMRVRAKTLHRSFEELCSVNLDNGDMEVIPVSSIFGSEGPQAKERHARDSSFAAFGQNRRSSSTTSIASWYSIHSNENDSVSFTMKRSIPTRLRERLLKGLNRADVANDCDENKHNQRHNTDSHHDERFPSSKSQELHKQVDGVRICFLEFFLHYLSRYRRTFSGNDINGFKREKFLDMVHDVNERGFVQELIGTRMFADFLVRETNSFDQLATIWETTRIKGKRSPLERSVHELLVKLGYGNKAAEIATAKLLLLPKQDVMDVFSSMEKLQNVLDNLELPENGEEAISNQLNDARRRRLWATLERKECPPIVVKMENENGTGFDDATLSLFPKSCIELLRKRVHPREDGPHHDSSRRKGCATLSSLCMLEFPNPNDCPHQSFENLLNALDALSEEVNAGQQESMYKDTIHCLATHLVMETNKHMKIHAAQANNELLRKLQEENNQLRRELAQLNRQNQTLLHLVNVREPTTISEPILRRTSSTSTSSRSPGSAPTIRPLQRWPTLQRRKSPLFAERSELVQDVNLRMYDLRDKGE